MWLLPWNAYWKLSYSEGQGEFPIGNMLDNLTDSIKSEFRFSGSFQLANYIPDSSSSLSPAAKVHLPLWIENINPIWPIVWIAQSTKTHY